jgi:hypothetical protein
LNRRPFSQRKQKAFKKYLYRGDDLSGNCKEENRFRDTQPGAPLQRRKIPDLNSHAVKQLAAAPR